jgi:FKBP12-rapamycin complex-associated protein
LGRLLTLWFKYAAEKQVEDALVEGFTTVSIDTWLQVVPQVQPRSSVGRHDTTRPTTRHDQRQSRVLILFLIIVQLIARIHSPVPSVARMVHDLLTNVGKEHPQALVYPLSVASKSHASARMSAANRCARIHPHSTHTLWRLTRISRVSCLSCRATNAVCWTR